MANTEQLTVLKKGVKNWNAWRRRNAAIKPDFFGANLERANLRGADLKNADLEEANLEEANLCKANLEVANLENANLEENILEGANLELSVLEGANLKGAYLVGAMLRGANLCGADLAGANLRGADLTGANLYKANLEGAILKEACLDESSLVMTDLKHADLRMSSMKRAILMKADLRNARLREADLESANLRNANLKGAGLIGANIEAACVTGVLFNRWGRFRGIRAGTCYGNMLFRRFVLDQAFIEEFRTAWWRRPIYGFWLVLADCGRSFWLWAGWCFLFSLLFAVIFHSLGEEAFTVNGLPWRFDTLAYYSVATFTTLGMGEITPKTVEAARWVMIEVVIGYVMLGGLISIFTLKLARRS